MSTDPTKNPAVLPFEIVSSQRYALRQYRSWPRFHYGPRKSSQPLLGSLRRYPGAVLVAGCQRSGTTMLTRVIAGASGFRGLALTRDDELDAALALCGAIDLPPGPRYCLQTTYLNERYAEYSSLDPSQRLIWVLRNPYSVVYSMVYNWKRFALNELYDGCGRALAGSARLRRTRLPWPLGPSAIEKACLAYSAKTSQIEEIRAFVRPEQLKIVDYDAIVATPAQWLGAIFDFIGEPYRNSYAASVRGDSGRKAELLSSDARALVRMHAEPAYRRCMALVSPASGRA